MREYKKRLTTNNTKEYDPEYDFCIGCKYSGEPNGCNCPNGPCDNYMRFNAIYSRLAELEDIEEELGIDLITLFRALKQGYIYEKLEDEITKSDVDMLDFREGIKGVCLDKSYEIDNYKQCYQTLKYINGYGKSYALTREELE